MKLPEDPTMLFSVVNMKLRDKYASLDELCRKMDVDKDDRAVFADYRDSAVGACNQSFRHDLVTDAQPSAGDWHTQGVRSDQRPSAGADTVGEYVSDLAGWGGRTALLLHRHLFVANLVAE